MIAETASFVGEVEEIPTHRIDYGLLNLPEPEKRTIFIVTNPIEVLTYHSDVYTSFDVSLCR